MRFIGNKELITEEIKALLEKKGLSDRGLTFFDAFSGTGAVSDALKGHYNLVVNDMLNWSVSYTRGRIMGSECTFEQLGFDPFVHFNNSTEISKGFFYNNYSQGGSERMYFSVENAGRIDFFRQTIQQWKDSGLLNENEFCLLMASLIESVSTVANIAGVYGAFLKHWDSRALKPIEFKKVGFKDIKSLDSRFLSAKIEEIIEDVDCDILYIDPPYTQNQYGTQYHILETLTLNDKPSISKITGSRSTTPMRSDWSKDYKSHILFDRILAKTKAKYVLFSYSKDGFMSKSFIEASMKRYGKVETFLCQKILYKKYTNFKSRANEDHFEYLFFIEKKPSAEVTYVSPLNYIGSKAKMAAYLKSVLPANLQTFLDIFGGGFNVGINVEANKIVYNDINHFVSALVESFRSCDTYQYILFLKRMIKRFALEPKDAAAYKKIRDYYNSFPVEKRDPKLLYAVILYGFNQQIRFNADHDFNNPVGMRWFNDKVLEKMISFSRVIKEKNVVFESRDYADVVYSETGDTFLYFDPPYMLTTGAYNDGKRGFNGWNESTEERFFKIIEDIDLHENLFMISYVLEHKQKINRKLCEWIGEKEFELIQVDPSMGNNRKEILITNYTNNGATSFHHQKQISKAG